MTGARLRRGLSIFAPACFSRSVASLIERVTAVAFNFFRSSGADCCQKTISAFDTEIAMKRSFQRSEALKPAGCGKLQG